MFKKIIVFIIIIVLFFSFFWIRNFFSQDKFVNFVKNQIVNNKAGLKIEIESIDANYKYVNISNLQIFDEQNKKIGTIEKVSVKIDFFSFFKNNSPFKNIKLIRPILNIEKLYPTNKKTNPKDVNKELTKLGILFFQSRLEIIDGDVIFKTKDLDLNLKNFNSKISSLRLNRNIEIKSDGKAVVNKLSSFKNFDIFSNIKDLDYKLDIALNLKSKKLIIKEVFIDNENLDFQTKGEAIYDKKGMMFRNFDCYGTIKNPLFLLENIKSLKTLKNKDILDNIKILGNFYYNFNLHSDNKKYYCKGKLNFKRANILYLNIINKELGYKFLIDFETVVDFRNSFFDITNFDLIFDKDKLSYYGYFDEKNKNYDLSFETDNNGLDASSLKNIFNLKQDEIKGKLEIKGFLKNNFKSFNLKLDNIFFNDKFDIIENVNGNIFFDDKGIKVDNLKGSINKKEFFINILENNFDINLTFLKMDTLKFDSLNIRKNKLFFLAGSFFVFCKKENPLNGKLKVKEIVYKALNFNNFNADFDYKKNYLKTKIISNLNDGKLQSNLDFDLKSFFKTKKYNDILGYIKLNFKDVKTDGLAFLFDQKYNITGTMTGNVDFELGQGNIDKLVSDIIIYNGLVIDLPFLVKISKLIKGVDFRKFKYDELVIKVNLFDKLLKVDTVSLVSSLGFINLLGHIDFFRKLLDLNLNLRIKGTNNKVQITGDFKKPKYKVDIKGILKNIFNSFSA
jgi:hypothetical protein